MQKCIKSLDKYKFVSYNYYSINTKGEYYMALIRCPECQHQVSDQAATCSYCGYPFAQIAAKREQELRKEQERQLAEQRAKTRTCEDCFYHETDSYGFHYCSYKRLHYTDVDHNSLILFISKARRCEHFNL